jgi:CRISPR-associated endonuclease/helicase Cas3
MIVTFVSQCEKKSLSRTRRILDAFANRIGNNVWQTAITEDGLKTVKQLLRKSATKSTAVSCHRNKTRQLTELVWIVGNKRRFNEIGVVPVNWTRRNLLHREWENEWTSLESMQIIATIAALLHDIGKSTIGFQHKLFHSTFQGDPYRHEWVSLKLFIWLVTDCQTDEQWLTRLQNLPEFFSSNTFTSEDLQQKTEQAKLDQLPPLAGWVAWLIVTHHRLPPLTEYWFNEKTAKNLKKSNNPKLKAEQKKFYAVIKAHDYWVRNPRSFDEMTETQQTSFWQFDELVIYSPLWQRKLKRWTKKAALHPQLQQLSQHATVHQYAISDPFLLHLSRLCLMIGDHNYSSLDANDKRRVRGSIEFKDKLAANTDRQTNEIKQALDEHLIGVSEFTAQFCRALPAIHEGLPRLTQHDPLVKNTAHKRFKWQNKAFKLAYQHRELSENHGFFGVNMASTGAGKTIGNARIMYGLSDPKKGARITVALGLRVLTLQTGLSFREDLQLNANQLAVLVGGSAQKQLFELNQNKASKNESDSSNSDNQSTPPDYQDNYESVNYESVYGSESANPLIDEWVDSEIDIADYEELGLGTVIESQKARELLFAPVVVCTIDHLMQASECKRGGKHIAPILRLLSSDLILDEPDDFDHNDLPALSRLIHLAGLFGTRVMLSSATLPPDMVQGLFEAYLAGRRLFNAQLQKSVPKVICGWFDENRCVAMPCDNTHDFKQHHSDFVSARTNFLSQQPTRRHADILPLSMVYNKEQHIAFYEAFAAALLNQAQALHQNHSILKKDSQHRVSIGLIRMANIQPLMNTAIAMFNLNDTPAAETTQYHLCCYHANQVLILRNRLEKKLDTILKRDSDDDNCLFKHDDITQAIQQNPNKTHHVFIVLATPVAEVGRDHDYDWAIVEPSSMRSIIQLAGRVWRHRPDKKATMPNISIMQYNIKSLKQPNRNIGTEVFTRPGFEQASFLLASHDTNEIIRASELRRVDAIPRIIKAPEAEFEATRYLSDLEHSVMADLMTNNKTNVVNGYWQNSQTSNRSHVHLSCLTPFRAGQAQVEYIIEPTNFKTSVTNNELLYAASNDLEQSDNHDFENQNYSVYIAEQAKEKGISSANSVKKVIKSTELPIANSHITPWLTDNLTDALVEVQAELSDLSPNTILIRFAVLSVYDSKNGWLFDERFGCWKDEGMFMNDYS